ncbi:zeaxanthin epoxidase, chloroplastic [Olea europaea subsp. europaea]|uniref:Zeaxanthin epoxidase, chloroplastic n=1 Tax=Olea europaea subsp. europaea TaxID=158383 RepID=A0A8S0PWM8_OLEEU|nr:zeaxanthin epoxidase, chloroplastic [Olea europaea subsp. europaea]
MEMTTQSLSYTKAKAHSPSPAFFPAKSTVFARSSVSFLGYNCLPRKLQCSARQLRNFGAISASDSETSPTNNSVRWLLEPVGDGDSRHIGYKTALPDAFEIASNVVTVGRTAGKADIVIPVPTVSGVHARIQKTEESLLITDLDSTNGTFIDEIRLQPGVVAAASPGNLITFGDTNLAIFKVSKLEVEPENPSETKSEDEPSSISESTS